MVIAINSRKFGEHKALVDDADADLVSGHKWSLTTRGYAAAKINGRKVLMHRLILNPGIGQVVDHRNHNKLDNRRSNIWVCSQRENQANRLDNKNSKTGLRGIHPFRGKYKVQVGRRYIGVFATIDEA